MRNAGSSLWSLIPWTLKAATWPGPADWQRKQCLRTPRPEASVPTIVLKPQDPSFPVPLRLKLQYQESVKTCQANFPSSPEVQQTPGKLKEVAAIPNSLVQLMLTQDDPGLLAGRLLKHLHQEGSCSGYWNSYFHVVKRSPGDLGRIPAAQVIPYSGGCTKISL